MAISRQGRSITFTAVNAGLDFGGLPKRLMALTFRGTGLTAGQLLIVRDTKTPGAGNILADYAIQAATDDADFWGGRTPQLCDGISIDNNTVAGTWVLTATIGI